MMKWAKKTANEATLGDLVSYSIASVALMYGCALGIWAAFEYRDEITEKAKAISDRIKKKRSEDNQVSTLKGGPKGLLFLVFRDIFCLFNDNC